MPTSKNIKMPLSSFGFPYLCTFIGLIHSGLQIVAQGIDDNAADITALTNEIIAGEISTLFVTQDGTVITTWDGTESFAVRDLD